jgi:glycosyltransferase involved in cell wall biosynthesis
MISVIICSADNNMLIAASKTVAETIGVPYELIAVDNSAAGLGICEVYNKGIKKAKYPILCFMHEDIIIHTKGWGRSVIKEFNCDARLGILGVAGSYYKPLSPSGWLGDGMDTECANLIQYYKFKNETPNHNYKNPNNEAVAEVACVDGLWFCTPKTVAATYKFDEETFKGFHCYDVDFSLTVGADYKVAVTYDVLLTHLSEGNFDKVWLSEIMKLHKKWDAQLPVNRGSIQKNQSIQIEKVTYKRFLDQLVAFKIPLHKAFQFLWHDSFLKKMDFKMFLKLNYYTLKKYIF